MREGEGVREGEEFVEGEGVRREREGRTGCKGAEGV